MEEDRGPAVTVIEGDAAPEPEAVAEAADAIEAQAEAAVEIAEVEAARDVEIAEIVAESQTEMAHAAVEDGLLERRLAELETWREQHGPPDHPAIWAALAEVQAMLLSISERLTPPPTPEPSPGNPPENPEPSEGGGEGEPGPTSNEPTPASEPEKPASPARKVRWI